MCFSANASFSAGVILTVIGIATIKKAEKPSQLLFASIPLIFGIQQIAEGVLWLSLPHPQLLGIQRVFTFIFLFFAQVIWPIWTPYAIIKLQKRKTWTLLQKLFVAMGLMVGLYLGACLYIFPVEAKLVGHHILYIQEYPLVMKKIVILFYASATIVPTFFSSIKKMWLLGATIVVSYGISFYFYDQYVLSVWCFFSSLISISIYAIVTQLSKQKEYQ